MDESTDEDKTLVANERSPRKRKKRKSRKKKIENVETNDECMTDQYTADTGKKTEKRNKRTLINLFKKSKESNLDKREFAHNDNGNSDIAYSNVDSEEIQISLFSKFDPQLQPRIRLGCMTLKDVMHEKYSAYSVFQFSYLYLQYIGQSYIHHWFRHFLFSSFLIFVFSVSFVIARLLQAFYPRQWIRPF
jgi:hypothetical protein